MQVSPARIVVQSPAVQEGQPIPREHTADGPNTSPALSWSNVPAGAKELVVALVGLDDKPQVAERTPMLYWVVYNIRPTVTGLQAGFPAVEVITAPPELDGAFQAYTVFDRPGYRGPQPPPGMPYRYRFTVYALDMHIELEQALGANAVVRALAGHIIGEGGLVVTYERALRQ